MTTIIKTKRGLQAAAAAAFVANGAAMHPVAAQESVEPLSVDVSECVKLATPEERLACFESRVEAARPAGASTPATAGSPPANSGADDRGLEREDPTPPDIYAKVAELRETVPNSYMITLDNGQVWRQSVPKPYALRPGSPVRIYFSKWRTYRLTNEQLRSFIQVERVR